MYRLCKFQFQRVRSASTTSWQKEVADLMRNGELPCPVYSVEILHGGKQKQVVKMEDFFSLSLAGFFL